MDVQLYMFINGAWQEYNPETAAHSHTWSEITGKPTTFNPSSHSHSISNITNLQSTLNAKLETETDPIFTAWNKSTGISITKSQVSDLIAATQSLPGLMSATDKTRLDALHALLEEDTSNNVVDSINEVLAIFNNYPEGADLVTALAGKVDKVSGKGLSTNDYTTTEKNKLAGIASGAEVNVQSDWNATSGDAFIKNKPTKVSDLTNDSGFITTETDPTVPSWAKTEAPGFVRFFRMNADNTLSWRSAADMRTDIGAATPANITAAVTSHNSSTLAHEDIRNSLSNKLETETDPTVPAWAKTTPPSALRYMRMNADNTITWRTAAQLGGDIGVATTANITTAVSNHNSSASAHASLFADKLDKITTPTVDPTVERVYGTDNAGNQKVFYATKFNYDDTIVVRDGSGNILDLVSHNSSEQAHASLFADKLPQYVYNNETSVNVTNIQGETGMPAINISESNQNITLGSAGISSVTIANAPTADSHAATKLYVDSKTIKLINNGSTTALSKTGYRALTVPANNYEGKTVAVELRYGSSSETGYTNQVIYVTLGSNTSTTASKTYPRFITLSEWDGEFLKHLSVKTYVTSGTTSSINFGMVKTLVGKFTGSTIEWTTNDTINIYIGKVWLVD